MTDFGEKKSRVLVIGAGGHGRAVADAICSSGEFLVAGFLDDGFDVGFYVAGFPVLGPVASLSKQCQNFDLAFVAVGNNKYREKLSIDLDSLGILTPTIVHATAYIGSGAKLGPHTVILAGSVVGADAVVGKGVIVNANSTVDHDCFLDDFSHLGVGVHLAGGVTVGKGAWLQVGSCAATNSKIVAGSVLPAGSVVC